MSWWSAPCGCVEMGRLVVSLCAGLWLCEACELLPAGDVEAFGEGVGVEAFCACAFGLGWMALSGSVGSEVGSVIAEIELSGFLMNVTGGGGALGSGCVDCGMVAFGVASGVVN